MGGGEGGAGQPGLWPASVNSRCPAGHQTTVACLTDYVAFVTDSPSLTEQPAWPQLQEISMVLPASLQYWLQYFSPFPTLHVQAG